MLLLYFENSTFGIIVSFSPARSGQYWVRLLIYRQFARWSSYLVKVYRCNGENWPGLSQWRKFLDRKSQDIVDMHVQSREGVNCALQRLEPFSCPEFGLPLASGASLCSAPQPGTVYLLRYEPPNCRWAPPSACWRLSFSSMRATIVRRHCDWTASSAPHKNIWTRLNSNHNVNCTVRAP